MDDNRDQYVEALSVPVEPDDEPRRRPFHRFEVVAYFTCLGVVLFLGITGFLANGLRVRDALYSTAQLFVLEYNVPQGETGWGLEVARLLAPALSTYALVKAVVVLFSEQLQLLLLRVGRGHVIVAGLGEKGWALVRSIRGSRWRTAIIERDPTNDRIETAKALGALVLVGDARDAVLLRKLRIDRARHLVAVCGDDATNIEIVVRAAEMVDDRPGDILECRAHIQDGALCHLLMTHELARHRNPRYQIEYFNLYERSAHDLISSFAPWPTPSAPSPHVAVGGSGPLAEHVVLQLGHEWLSARNSPAERMVISLLDAPFAARLSERYPTLALACELRAGMDPEARPLSSAYMCHASESEAVAAALALLPRAGAIPVVVCLRHKRGLGSLLTGERSDQYQGLHAFGVLDEACDRDLLRAGVYESIARSLHAEYVRNERKAGRTPAENPAMVPWRYLPVALRESNRHHANHIGAKLASVGCRLEPLLDWNIEPIRFTDGEIEFLGELEHERWVRERAAAGWRPGSVKDIQEKRTPFMVGWDDLPDEVREYDRMFVRRLPAILADAGFQVTRCPELFHTPPVEKVTA